MKSATGKKRGKNKKQQQQKKKKKSTANVHLSETKVGDNAGKTLVLMRKTHLKPPQSRWPVPPRHLYIRSRPHPYRRHRIHIRMILRPTYLLRSLRILSIFAVDFGVLFIFYRIR